MKKLGWFALSIVVIGVSGCMKSPADPLSTPTNVVIPGAGSTYSFVEFGYNATGNVIPIDTLSLVIGTAITHGGYPDVSPLIESNPSMTDTTYWRFLQNGDLMTDLGQSPDGTLPYFWVTLPFASINAVQYPFDTLFTGGSFGGQNNSTVITSQFVGSEILTLRGLPLTARIVKITSAQRDSSQSGITSLTVSADYSYIPSRGILGNYRKFGVTSTVNGQQQSPLEKQLISYTVK